MNGRQIVANGPWLPAEVLQALEEQRLMFFCGAGVSMGPTPWGLPDFKELTRLAYESCNQPMEGGLPTDIAARDAFCREQYDKALEILEVREGHQGQMRSAIADRLISTDGLEDDVLRVERLVRHRALLDLAELREPVGNRRTGYRLVTTNFDNRFELADPDIALIEDGPCLRPPIHEKPSRLVHLHGRIGNHDPGHSDLVLTTRDFGNAYLRHGWAARFVVELFREFTVLFIGYSLSDPVMRYLMDVFATERGERRQFRSAYALVSFDGNITRDREHQEDLWRAKRVDPILYNKNHEQQRPHCLLDDTLGAWAAERRLGLAGRLKVATDATSTRFQRGTDDTDPFNKLASVVWALDTDDGEIAGRFADHHPSPDISWFGPIVSHLIRRPTNKRDGQIDANSTIVKQATAPFSPVASALSRWACKHLSSDSLVSWVNGKQGTLFPEFRQMLENKLSDAQHPTAAPYNRFWQLVLLVEEASHQAGHRLAESAVNPYAALLNELEPRLTGPRPSYREELRSLLGESEAQPIAVADLGWFEVGHAGDFALKANKLHRTIVGSTNGPTPELVDAADALTSILIKWVELARLAERPIERRALPYLIRDRHPERYDSDLDILLDLTMASFSGLVEERPEEAKAIAGRWKALGSRADHALFIRLWLWAAADFELLDPSEMIGCLIDRQEILWGDEYEPEVLRLLRLRAGQARRTIQTQLGSALMRQPPRGSPPGHFSEKEENVTDQRAWRLWKTAVGGVAFKGRVARLAEAILKEWREHAVPQDAREIDRQISPDETARYFPEPDAGTFIGAPAGEIVAAIVGYTGSRDRAGFAEQVAVQQPERAAELLAAMRAGGLDDPLPYNGIFWGLRFLARSDRTDRTADTRTDIPHLLGSVATALVSDDALAALCLDGAASWLGALQSASDSDTSDLPDFWRLWDVLLAVKRDLGPSEQSDERPYDTALNAAGGSLADALIENEGRLGGPAGRRLSARHRPKFDRLVNASGAIGVHGRVQLVMQLQWLHTIDPDWTEQNLLSRLAWNWPDRAETIRLWRTFAFRSRSGPALFVKLAPAFREALKHSEDLGELSHHSLCRLFGGIVAETPSMFDRDHAIAMLHMIGPEGCAQVLEAFQHKLRAAGAAAPALWRERIAPWLKDHWPADYSFRSGRLANEAIEVALLTRGAFPEAKKIICETFRLDSIGDNVLWLFILYNIDEDIEYDYLSSHLVEVGDLVSKVISNKPTSFARMDMPRLLRRVSELSPEGRPAGWELPFERYEPDHQTKPRRKRKIERR